MLDDDDDSTPDAEKRQLAIAKRLEARMVSHLFHKHVLS